MPEMIKAPAIVATALTTIQMLLGLSDRANDLVRSYSLGIKQRLGVAAAFRRRDA